MVKTLEIGQSAAKLPPPEGEGSETKWWWALIHFTERRGLKIESGPVERQS
jgi:hypothetical protein